ncbi:MAG: ABC transporter ATP-binding protein [Pirellulaceae bacterium]|nr:ABC transporter ATP-binding protein [Pirellulaceae bacterium]
MVTSSISGVHSEQFPAIELRRLHRFFGRTKAVQDVTFEVHAGQVFGFIGPNGAGKTTSMRILATLELPTFGDALVDGFSCINDPDLVRQRMGFMPDGFGTYPNMNCVEYLDFFARAYGLVGKDRVAAIRRTLSFTGLDKIASKNIRGLSKGMRQRLCLGRAMVHDPKVLILDEPANGLDPRARIELRVLISQLATEGKAILVSSHILTELSEMCDRVGIIERGQLLAVGSVAEIQRGSRSSLTVTIQTIDRTPELVAFLASQPLVSEVSQKSDWVSCQLAGGHEEQAALLRNIVQADFQVTAFGATERSLEDVFMQITTGAVQ